MGYDMTKEEYEKLKNDGYSDDDIKNAIREYNKNENTSYISDTQPQSTSMFTNYNNDNLIKWQLELDSILQNIEHLLRGDIVKVDDVKGKIWQKATEENRLMNDKGVNEICRILLMYLNRNTILSNFSEKEIKVNMYDIATEINDLFYTKYEEWGLDNKEKRKSIPMMVLTIINTVESAYNRALNGGERDSLREARQFSQVENIQQGLNNNYQQKSRGGAFNPKNWF